MIDVKTTRPSYSSPLRYPGGKSSLADFLGNVIAAMPVQPANFVEPFAGGAGAAVSLLLSGRVRSIVINDLDPAVFAFWNSLTADGANLLARVRDIQLTLAEWERQREAYKDGIEGRRNQLDLAVAFFYLNRTNRSGVLNAGVIGGKSQSGRYKIDARFNRDQLLTRLTLLHDLRDRITVTSQDGRSVVEAYATDVDSFLYVDPPYVQMGGSLYLNSFTELDHALLALCLNRHSSANWVLTYDDVQLIRDLYAHRISTRFSLHYSANNRGLATELMVVSDPVAAALAS